ncbi:MAG: ABC transporter ATP-binding protein [Bacteroidetes bacterium CG2_30_33_31]|nr:MAG: ABC transporter ATP-binding protein [Bacteroidetes bacterium CG2_30_33_31]
MIEARKIFKSYENKDVLYDINIIFERGKINQIIGQSGSGKTVLMKCLVGLDEVTSGDVFYDERNFTKMSMKERKILRQELGMVFQAGALFDSMPLMDNIMFPLQMFSKMSQADMIKRAEFCLDRVGLSDAGNVLPDELSGGMQKRASIARAIALNPKYLFCDEPNSGLDPKTGVKIDDLIEEITLEFGITTVINTHDMNSVIQHGDNINYIAEGKVEWQGNKNDFLTSRNIKLNDFIYSTELLKRIKARQ